MVLSGILNRIVRTQNCTELNVYHIENTFLKSFFQFGRISERKKKKELAD